jgi:hypothetical protein
MPNDPEPHAVRCYYKWILGFRILPQDDRATSEPLLEFIIVFAFGALCFGCGYLTAFIVTRTKFRNQMIKRGAAHYDSETGKWDWEKPPKSR